MPLILTKENEREWLEGKLDKLSFEEKLVTTEL
jgi:hypothetical protein